MQTLKFDIFSDLGSQYAAEQSVSKASATITSAKAEVSRTELNEVEEAILEIEDTLKRWESSMARITSLLRTSSIWRSTRRTRATTYHQVATPMLESETVLETANRVKEVFQQEASAPKASSSSEQAATQAEDPGAEFCENLVFMRQTPPEAAVTQPTPVQPTAVPMLSQQAEETPKWRLPSHCS